MAEDGSAEGTAAAARAMVLRVAVRKGGAGMAGWAVTAAEWEQGCLNPAKLEKIVSEFHHEGFVCVGASRPPE